MLLTVRAAMIEEVVDLVSGDSMVLVGDEQLAMHSKPDSVLEEAFYSASLASWPHTA